MHCHVCVCVCCRSLAVGTKTGYKLFSLTMVEKLDCIHESGQYVALLLQVLRQCGLNICLHSVNNYISVKSLRNANFPRQSGSLYNMVHSEGLLRHVMYSVLFGITTMTGDTATSCTPLLDVKEIVVSATNRGQKTHAN